MEYIKIEDGIITGHRAGRNPGEDWTATPNGFWGVVGDRVAYYDDSWHRIDDVTLVRTGKMEMPEGMKFNDSQTELIPMDEDELIIAGVKPLPIHQKIVDGKLEEKTIREMWLDGSISTEDFTNYKRMERDSLLTATDKYMVIDFPIDEDYRHKIKEYRQVLRDITKSNEWPDVEFPLLPTK